MAGISINSNIASLQSQRLLTQNSSALNRTFQRLSSGQRINRASDDAAGLALSESMKADVQVYEQGKRNLNDGISMLSIAEGAVSELTNIVTRLKELAEQSSNGSLSNTQRDALDAEGQSLAKEYLRISQTTVFNGQKLFDGSVQGLNLQAGYGANATLQLSVGGKIGTGDFQTRVLYSAPTRPSGISMGDLNGDGVNDLVTTNYSGFGASVYLGNDDGTFKARTNLNTDKALDGTLGDVNNDGTLDYIELSSLDTTVEVSIGNGDGTFKSSVSYAVFASHPTGISLGDFNGDGKIDIVETDNTSAGMSVLLGNGNGSFKARADYAATSIGGMTQTADFNRDGFDDVILTDYGSAAVSVYLANSNGTLKARSDYTVGPNPQSPAIYDLDSDGYLDIVTPNSSGTLSVLLGNSNGTFKAKTDYTAGGGSVAVRTGDFNGDGLADLASANYSAGTISVLLGNGNGSFRAKADFSTGGSPQDLVIGDFNGDGVVDLAAANYSGNQVAVLIAKTQDGVSPLADFSLGTQAGALQASNIFNTALKNSSLQRGIIGAYESRVESATSLVSNSTEALTAAYSRIRDADVAEETADLVRRKILQQATTAVLSSANQQPALALSLIQGNSLAEHHPSNGQFGAPVPNNAL